MSKPKLSELTKTINLRLEPEQMSQVNAIQAAWPTPLDITNAIRIAIDAGSKEISSGRYNPVKSSSPS